MVALLGPPVQARESVPDLIDHWMKEWLDRGWPSLEAACKTVGEFRAAGLTDRLLDESGALLIQAYYEQRHAVRPESPPTRSYVRTALPRIDQRTPEEKAEAEARHRANIARIDEQHAERQAAIWKRMMGAIDEFVGQMKVEWTHELLASTFSLPDGSAVTWGDATEQQHLAAAGVNLELLARHTKAAETLRQAGKVTLREVVG